ncbi:MAG: DUF3429 domain-containing protein [Rhodocyclaceae bacterium]|nr:DUF3429 domain-containing protein [Rhodocyclaceae bacterium]
MATPRPKRVALLGYGGLLPFIGLSIGSVVDHHHALIWVDALHAYGAVILSFVGALHWGFAMLANDLGDAERDARYLWSVIPALLAWPALLLSGLLASGMLVLGFVLHYWQDRRLANGCALPPWYLPLRGRLTGVACLCLIGSVLAS